MTPAVWYDQPLTPLAPVGPGKPCGPLRPLLPLRTLRPCGTRRAGVALRAAVALRAGGPRGSRLALVALRPRTPGAPCGPGRDASESSAFGVSLSVPSERFLTSLPATVPSLMLAPVIVAAAYALPPRATNSAR